MHLCVSVWNIQRPIVACLSFDHPFDPLWWLSSSLSNWENSWRSPAVVNILLCWDGFESFFLPSLSSAKILSYENTDNHMLTPTQKHLWSITRFLCPFAFPAVWSCQVPWHCCGFSILLLRWQKLCAVFRLITDIRKSLLCMFLPVLCGVKVLLIADLFSKTIEILLDSLTFSLNVFFCCSSSTLQFHAVILLLYFRHYDTFNSLHFLFKKQQYSS